MEVTLLGKPRTNKNYYDKLLIRKVDDSTVEVKIESYTGVVTWLNITVDSTELLDAACLMSPKS